MLGLGSKSDSIMRVGDRRSRNQGAVGNLMVGPALVEMKEVNLNVQQGSLTAVGARVGAAWNKMGMCDPQEVMN